MEFYHRRRAPAGSGACWAAANARFAFAGLPDPFRRLSRAPWRQRADMPPRLRHDIGEERSRNLCEPDEHRGITAIVLAKEERIRVQLHQDLALADRRELQNEHSIIVPETREKPAIQKEGRHAIRPPLRDFGKVQQKSSSGLDRHSTNPTLLHLGSTRNRHAAASFKRLLGAGTTRSSIARQDYPWNTRATSCPCCPVVRCSTSCCRPEGPA